jgi:hypothetical protein
MNRMPRSHTIRLYSYNDHGLISIAIRDICPNPRETSAPGEKTVNLVDLAGSPVAYQWIRIHALSSGMDKNAGENRKIDVFYV